MDQKPVLAKLVEEVDVGTKWYQLGIQLYLEPKKLDSIYESCPPDRQVTKMYQLWLDTNPDATNGDLISALRTKSVGENTLAEAFESFLKKTEEYTEYFNDTEVSDDQSLSKTEVQTVSELNSRHDNESDHEVLTAQLVSETRESLLPQSYANKVAIASEISTGGMPLSERSHQSAAVSLKFPEEKIRAYQWELAKPGLNGENYIICAPTGSGKTLIAALIIYDHLKKKEAASQKAKVLFLVKTQQLAHQQKDKLREYLSGVEVIEITGESEITIYTTLPHVDIIVCTAGKLSSELNSNLFRLSEATLLILDECHHIAGREPYAEVMEYYLLEKRKGVNLHVVGMTASPGAGRGRYPSIAKAIAHQVKLCARINATSGIKCVQENIGELKQHMHPPSHTSHPLQPRNPTDPFIEALSDAMAQLETMLPLPSIPTFNRCTPAYQQWIKNEIEAAQLSGMDQQRDQISILELLEAYYLARITYEDFEICHAKEVLEEVNIKDEAILNEMESKIQSFHVNVKYKLMGIKGCPNQLLQQAEEVLFQHFSTKRDSKALFFVRDIKHTQYVIKWIKSRPTLNELIRPSSVTGHSKTGMSKDEQVKIIERFRNGDYNLLLSTSVLEEGLDVPECNMVIRFQIMSNEIAEIQAQGRARAENSTMHTIITSDSHIHHRNLINEDKKILAVNAVEFLSKEGVDLSSIEKHQDEILAQREERILLEQESKRIWNPDDVDLLCRKCGVVACKASDVCKYGTNKTAPHYIVPSDSFSKKMKKMDRKGKAPASAYAGDFTRPYKIGCVVCSEEWGIWGCWKTSGVQYPVLKCTSFTFRNNTTNQRDNFKQWKKVPFNVFFYNEYEEQDS